MLFFKMVFANCQDDLRGHIPGIQPPSIVLFYFCPNFSCLVCRRPFGAYIYPWLVFTHPCLSPLIALVTSPHFQMPHLFLPLPLPFLALIPSLPPFSLFPFFFFIPSPSCFSLPRVPALRYGGCAFDLALLAPCYGTQSAVWTPKGIGLSSAHFSHGALEIDTNFQVSRCL